MAFRSSCFAGMQRKLTMCLYSVEFSWLSSTLDWCSARSGVTRNWDGSSLLAHSRLSRLPRPPFGALPLPAHKRPTIQLEECVGRLLASSVSCDIIRIKIRVAVPPSHYSCFTNEDSCRSTDFQKTMWPVLHRRTTTIVVNSQNSCRLHKCESPGKNKCIDT